MTEAASKSAAILAGHSRERMWARPIGTFSTDPSGVLGGFQAGYNLKARPLTSNRSAL
jgi:hypothetical protein